MPEGDDLLPFQRAQFRTKLPRDRRYTAGHMWLRRTEGDLWQVGLTRFAMRMIGEPVEIEFEATVGEAVETGRVVGWLEGFKAVSDLYAPLGGRFAGPNPLLEEDLRAVHASTYGRGWLFAVEGEPGSDCLDAEGYAEFLGATIDRMVGEERKPENGGQA